MVQIEGKYANYKNENLDAYFADIGVPYIPRKMICSSKPNMEIVKENDTWTISTSTLLKTTVLKFKLNEEYEESMPGGTLKNTTTMEGDNKLITKSVGPGDIKSARDYEFNDDECIITFSSEKTTQVAKRFFKRV
ncbi:unnamed protein product [Psylliodes chrysocephalus]|uniref:Lipocalin/cytosolic fatty-acid binding domain-containing protein n=1 Tax=Psylliodes chrysocephalus TaxID=3402493 RepID=A0A9P0CI40_9CUCU|nr:unnamed protein product [Psylliodes chrysocephala]